MKLVITTGTQSGATFAESHRWTIDITQDASFAEILEQVKRDCVPSVPVLNREYIRPYLYLMHADTLERFDEGKTIKGYALEDGSIIRLMSSVR